MKTKYWILTVIALSTLFFFIGRYTINEGEVKYVSGETVTGSVPEEELVPVKEEKGEDKDLPMKRDTIIKEVYLNGEEIFRIDTFYTSPIVDTAAIIAEFQKKRYYEHTLFDNKTEGRLIVYPTVYQNRLTALDYKFTPMQREIQKMRVWQPFLSGSYSTLDYVGLGVGLFYHNIGFEYQYNIDIRSKPVILQPVDKYFERGNYHWFSGKYKF